MLCDDTVLFCVVFSPVVFCVVDLPWNTRGFNWRSLLSIGLRWLQSGGPFTPDGSILIFFEGGEGWKTRIQVTKLPLRHVLL